MTGIMKKYGTKNCFFFCGRYFHTFYSESPKGHIHQVHSAKAMLKPAVIRTRVNKTCKTKLFNVSQPLKPWMLNQVENEISRDAYESIDRIIDDLSLICFVTHL
jgi:hypothetical protein